MVVVESYRVMRNLGIRLRRGELDGNLHLGILNGGAADGYESLLSALTDGVGVDFEVGEVLEVVLVGVDDANTLGASLSLRVELVVHPAVDALVDIGVGDVSAPVANGYELVLGDSLALGGCGNCLASLGYLDELGINSSFTELLANKLLEGVVEGAVLCGGDELAGNGHLDLLDGHLHVFAAADRG